MPESNHKQKIQNSQKMAISAVKLQQPKGVMSHNVLHPFLVDNKDKRWIRRHGVGSYRNSRKFFLCLLTRKKKQIVDVRFDRTSFVLSGK